MNEDFVQFISAAIFFGIILWFTYYLYHSRKSIKESLVDDGTEKSDSDVIYIHYRGECITMTNWEYLNQWLFMNRESKNSVLESQINKLKRGLVVRKFVNNSDYILETTEKGKDLSYRVNKKHINVNAAN